MVAEIEAKTKLIQSSLSKNRFREKQHKMDLEYFDKINKIYDSLNMESNDFKKNECKTLLVIPI